MYDDEVGLPFAQAALPPRSGCRSGAQPGIAMVDKALVGKPVS